MLGDAPLQECAPIVDLWVKKARRNGATIVTLRGRGRRRRRPHLVRPGRPRRRPRREPRRAGSAPAARAFYVPATPNGRGIADAWACASDAESAEQESIGLLLVSGDEAANDPNVRALAERADAVIVVSMFHGLAAGWADLVLPGTSYLERDGTYVNLEGRIQRLRRAVAPPARTSSSGSRSSPPASA